jgi:hypothetical protein
MPPFSCPAVIVRYAPGARDLAFAWHFDSYVMHATALALERAVRYVEDRSRPRRVTRPLPHARKSAAGRRRFGTPLAYPPRPQSVPVSRRYVPNRSPAYHFKRLVALLAWVALPTGTARAQADSSTASLGAPARSGTLGLSAIGAFSVHAGAARVQRGYSAGSLGGTMDFGYLRSRRVRVVADLTYLLTTPRTEVVESEQATYRDVFRDLSAHVAFTVHANDPSRRLSPYLVAGGGVDVLSSSFNSLTIDTRYNSNNFSLLGAMGARLRLGAASRRALTVELRGVLAHEVRRAAVHVGLATLFNDLAPGGSR